MWHDHAGKPITGRVFSDSQGRLMDAYWFTTRAKVLRRDSGVVFTMNNLRDTFGSVMAATDGVTMAELKMMMGHTSLSTTLKYYVGSFDSRLDAIQAAANATVASL